MHTILLSGGSGKRLWPLSNDLRSKQYIKLISKESDDTEQCSMVQRVWSQLEDCGLSKSSVICASTGQIEMIRSQLGSVNIAVEPNRRDTFPAVALSCAYVKSKLGAKDDDIVCVLPVDPYTEKSYFETVKKLETVLKSSNADIALMGANPTYASSKYGYIVPANIKANYMDVKGFKEKPTEEQAAKLIAQGALWNCGVFCFKIGMVLDKVKAYGIATDYEEMYKQYDTFPKISFDYEVLEKANNLVAVPFSGYWKDLGTWNTLAEQMVTNTIGDVIIDNCSQHTQVINELNIPVVVMGAKDMVVVASFDGILVTDKQSSSYIKEVTQGLDLPPMYEERRWGTIKTIDICNEGSASTLTRRIKIFEGMSSSYHYHKNRDEIWTVLKGSATLILEGAEVNLSEGSAICIRKYQKHAVKAITEFEYLETHIGSEVGNTDFNRITFDWNEIERAQLN